MNCLAINRLYEERYNNQGCLMKIVEYNKHSDIVVEFQDDYKFRTNTTYSNFKNGQCKNPYIKSVYGHGIIGTKYPVSFNCEAVKEYDLWANMLKRCFYEKTKKRQPAYNNVTCCDEWLSYENFYEWVHSQDNFEQWYHGKRWALDKDINVKGNRIYSPEMCCLVPQNVNCLLLKRDALRGNLPLGVKIVGDKFEASCNNPFTGKTEHLGRFKTPEEAFYSYKHKRECHIRQVAKIEYDVGNITKQCYDALMNYSIEIDD